MLEIHLHKIIIKVDSHNNHNNLNNRQLHQTILGKIMQTIQTIIWTIQQIIDNKKISDKIILQNQATDKISQISQINKLETKKELLAELLEILQKKAGVAALKGAAKLPLAIALGAASLGTGNLSNAITGAQTGWGISGNILSNESEKGHIHNFAKIYNDLVGANGQNIYAGHDNNWIREHTKDLLNGDVQAKDYEKEYYDAILKEMDRYIDQGLSADDAVTQVEQNVAGIQGGYLGEATLRQRFTGRINQVINRRRNNHNYNSPDGDVNNNNEPEDDENI